MTLTFFLTTIISFQSLIFDLTVDLVRSSLHCHQMARLHVHVIFQLNFERIVHRNVD